MKMLMMVAGVAGVAMVSHGAEPIRLARLFSEGAVVQREKVVPVWGWSTPDTVVFARLGSVEAWGGVAADGRFTVRLPAQKAGGPYELVVSNAMTHAVTTVGDVMVGEVWVASGQSNMSFAMKDSPQQLAEFNAANPDPSLIREFNVGSNASGFHEADCTPNSSWRYSERGAVQQFSAVGCWFAYALQRKLGVTVGIINSSWGGTCIEAWTDRETLQRNPFSAKTVARADGVIGSPERWKEKVEKRGGGGGVGRSGEDRIRLLAKHYQSDMPNEGVGKGWAAPDFDDSKWRSVELPANWSYEVGGIGIGWLRKTVEVPAAWAGQDIVLHFGGIDKSDITYFNGEEVGHTGGAYDESVWNVPRAYRVPGRLVKPGRNVVVVRNYSFVYDAGFNGASSAFRLEAADGSKVSLAGTWRIEMERSFGVVMPMGRLETPLGPGNPNTPSILFDGMIEPLLPYALRGFIWYQGESNAGDVTRAAEYARQMNEMITDWRFRFQQGDLPFAMVQLAAHRRLIGYDNGSAWAILRQSQLQATKALPNVGLAVAIDVGDPLNIHPTDKKTVGARLAAWAFKEVYGFADAVQSPKYLGKRRDGAKLRLRFIDGGAPLELRPGRDGLTGFYVSGDGEKFVPAQAVIEGKEVVLTAPGVAEPRSVAYCWTDCPLAYSLYNKQGLPASPFRD